MIPSPEQCRAARALLGWSQDDLQQHSGVAKKTIADLERGARFPHERTRRALTAVLEGSGVEFIPENGGGAGVRLKIPSPRLVRRSDVPEKGWVAFSFDYKARRITAFVRHEALRLEGAGPESAFDSDRQRILLRAAEMSEATAAYPEGQIVLTQADLPDLKAPADE